MSTVSPSGPFPRYRNFCYCHQLMKVLQINKLYYPHIGGVEKHVQDLAETLSGRVELEVLVANDSRRATRDLVNGVTVTRVPSWVVVQSAPVAPGFWRAIKRSRADIYHLHFPNPFGELAYLAAGAPGKLVVTYHSDVVRQKYLKRVYAPVINKLLRRADAVLASSPNLIRSSPWLESIKHKCRVIPFGIDLAPLRATTNTSTAAQANRVRYGSPLVLFVGRLIYYKGLSYLIDAMREINAKLVIVGEGNLDLDLKTQAETAGVADRVFFVGSASEIELAAYYQACDLLVLPSIAPSEAFGFVQLEAHACGKPVVSTNLPTGVPYANLDGVTGLIVPPANSRALASAINRLLSDNALRLKLGSQAKERVEMEFSRQAMADTVLGIYEEICYSVKP